MGRWAQSLRSRDQHEPLREQMKARMKTPAGRAKYRRRSFLAETPFAVLNTTMNVRQLLLRGISKVRTEIGWICSASNLKKITRLLAAQRRKVIRATGCACPEGQASPANQVRRQLGQRWLKLCWASRTPHEKVESLIRAGYLSLKIIEQANRQALKQQARSRNDLSQEAL